MPTPASSTRVAILGAGITGLTATWRLHQAGLKVTVFEKSGHVGGAIGAVRSDGWLHERGPNSLLEGSAQVTSLIDSLGLTSRKLYAASAAKRRYVIRNGRLVPLPSTPFGFIGTPLFSWRAKFGLLGEPWRPRSRPMDEETVAEFVVRRLGQEFLDYAINPFVGGVYAGDPARLSVRHAFPKLHALEQEHGSLIRGAIRRRNSSGGPKGQMFSFPLGLGELPGAIGNRLGDAIRLRHAVLGIRRRTDDWQITYEINGEQRVESFDAVVCALPANGLAALTFDGVPAAKELTNLSAIEQPPVASIFMGYRREDVSHPLDGFGLLAPAVEQRNILGTLFSSTLFPGRAPNGFVGLTSFVGGMRNPALIQLDDAALVALVHKELCHLLGARAAPVYTHVQRCPRAIPQYAVGYQHFHRIMSQLEASAPGLFIGGNCRDGISLSNCIASGERLASAVLRGLTQTVPATQLNHVSRP
ncbi:MAG: protoporphyrinogen oxidase [Opitutus sp.]